MGTLGSRVTSFGLADLRGGLSAGFDEGTWITTSFGIGQMLIGVASPYLGAVFGVRRVLLLGITLFFYRESARPVFSQPSSISHHSFSRWRRLRDVHSPYDQFHPPKPAFPSHHLRARHLCDELGAVAEHR